MDNTVLVKLGKYGINIILDKNAPFEQIARDICSRFAKSRDFWGKAEMIISLEGRELSSEEVTCIVEAIELNSDVKVILIEQNDVLRDIRMKDKLDKYYYEETLKTAKIIPGTIKRNATIKSDGSIVILGDVKKGAKVEAAGNVIVTGSVEGNIYAGYPEDKNAFIVSADFQTRLVTIGGITKEFEINKKWSLRAKQTDNEFHGVIVWNNNELLCEPIKSGLLKQLKR